MIRRRVLAALTLLAITGTTIQSPAEPSGSRLTQRNDASNALSWTGTVARPAEPCARTAAGLILTNPPQQLDALCVSGSEELPPSSDAHTFTVDIGTARTARVTTYVIWETPEDLDVVVTDDKGNVVSSSAAGPGDWEVISYTVSNKKSYTVTVVGALNANTAYRAYTWVRSTAGRNFSGPGRLRYPRKSVFATVDIPINVVFVGFDANEVAEHRKRVLDQIPPSFRPVIRIGSSSGGLGVVRREPNRDLPFVGFEGEDVLMEPIEYRYRPKIITASESWSRSMFAAAKRATTAGDYALPFDREYLERYNRRAGALRGPDGQVLPAEDIDFVDGMTLEDWVARNPPAGLNFDLRKPANGYTYFVMDSFRPSYAADFFNPNRFHNFRVMNSLTIDPDSGLQNGIDWARVWGGRYRFLMLDAGAAPNSWEADATLANARNFRVAGNGDSSKHDPPIWHYQAPADLPGQVGLPRDVAAPVEALEGFYDRVGSDVQMAIWMRFTRGYLYRPGAYDKFILAGNTWHDADAYAPWPSQLEKLYKDKLILQRYKELIPYSQWQGFSKFKYLTAGDAEQQALDAGKQRSISGLPVPFAVNPYPMMNLVNRNRPRYAPIVPGAFTVPVINVVFPKMYTWELPAVVGGVAVGEGGEPWGQIQNVNDRQKTFAATGPVTDSAGVRHEPLAPDIRETAVESVPGGIDNVGRFGFTGTALHEAGHFFGLSHTHDAVAYDWRLSPEAADPSKPNGYYEVIDWMYTTTASPMGYGWEYNRFEVLDKDNIWIGHALEWLTQAQESLADAYAALDSRRMTRLTPEVSRLKAATESLMTRSSAALRSGRYLEAVKLAQTAKNAAASAVASAARAVVRTRSADIGRAAVGSAG
ncbi:MAG: hypothetical protein ACRDJM_06760, partial [Actinomycetota bacterium]